MSPPSASRRGEKASVSMFLPDLGGGGAERVSVNLANELAERGHRVDLVLGDAKGAFLTDASPKVRVVDLRARRMVAAILPLRRYLRSERPDVLFSHLDHANVAALLARRLARVETRVVPVVHMTHSQDRVHARSRKEPILREAIRRLYPTADRIVAVSRGSADDMVRDGLPEALVRVIYNPALTPRIKALASQRPDHRWFAPGAPAVILGIGRLTPQKDFETLICAFALLREEQDCRLLILGDGEERAALERLVAALGLREHVELPGFVKNPFAYLARCPLFVLSSAWEALPTVLIEALSLGVPVVSTDCPSGPREILQEGRYGRLTPVGNAGALARGMREVLRGTRPDVPESALRPFTLDASVDEYVKLIGELTHA